MAYVKFRTGGGLRQGALVHASPGATGRTGRILKRHPELDKSTHALGTCGGRSALHLYGPARLHSAELYCTTPRSPRLEGICSQRSAYMARRRPACKEFELHRDCAAAAL